MANVRNANSFYVDTAAGDADPGTSGNLAGPFSVTSIIVTADGGVAELNLHDVTTDAIKINIQVPADATTEHINLIGQPLLFPNGIHPETVSNCKATLIVRESNK